MTAIQWSDETWNPIVGCSRISAGCANCYAADAAKSARLQQFSQYRKVGDWNGTIEFVESQLLKPLGWKKPRKIFGPSMSDLFHKNVEEKWLDRIFAVMALCPQHTFQVLTKRPERMREYLSDSQTSQRIASWIAAEMQPHSGLVTLNHSVWEKFSFPLPNVWLGVSVENQQARDRIPILLETPAAIRFLSCEPVLEAIDIRKHLGICVGCQTCDFVGCHRIGKSNIDWVICGGESGNNARPCNIDWLRYLVAQCEEAQTPVFVKQYGSNPIQAHRYIDGVVKSYSKLKLRDKKGGDISEFSEDLQVRQFP